jgi:hypothetical protein
MGEVGITGTEIIDGYFTSIVFYLGNKGGNLTVIFNPLTL